MKAFAHLACVLCSAASAQSVMVSPTAATTFGFTEIPPQATSTRAIDHSGLEVGISDHAQELELRLHAPSNGMLPLTYANAGSLGYRVLDPAGRLITTGRLAASAQPRTELIDITALGAGLHLIEVAGDGQRRTMRFFVD